MNSLAYTATLLDHQRAENLGRSNELRRRHAERAADTARVAPIGFRSTVRRLVHGRTSPQPQRIAHVR